jgi:hypothetical protein
MILAKKIDSQLLWSELKDNEAESIQGGHSMSRSGGSRFSRIINITIIQVIQTNIVTIIGNITGNVIIIQGNSSRGRGR